MPVMRCFQRWQVACLVWETSHRYVKVSSSLPAGVNGDSDVFTMPILPVVFGDAHFLMQGMANGQML